MATALERPPGRFRRRRMVAAALSCALVAGAASLTSAPTVGAEEPATTVVTAERLPSIDSISTPAVLTVRGYVRIAEPGQGTFTVSVYRPATGSADPCTGTPHSTKTMSTTATAVPTPDPESTTPTTLPATTVPVTYTLDVNANIRITDPQGVYRWQAVYTPKGGTPIKSACGSTLAAHRSDGGPDDPDLDPGSFDGVINRQFRLLLGRAATRAELDYWSNRIDNDDATPGDVAANIRESDDHKDHVDPAVRLYSAYFLRTPDAAGLKYWIGQLRNGRSLIWVSDFFSQSPEFQRRYGSLTNAQFIDLIYENILGRDGDRNGIAFWNDQLDRGLRSRGDVMVGFSESPEYKEATANEVHVAVLYALLLGRAPTAEEFESTVELLDITDTPLPFTVADLANDLLNL
jgi:hypothetical protein